MDIDMIFFKTVLKYKVVHSIPGRIRIHIPFSDKVPKEWLPWIENPKIVSFLTGIEKITFSQVTGNALIYYDTNQVTENEILDALSKMAKILKHHRQEIKKLATKDQEEAIKYLTRILEIHFDGLISKETKSLESE